MAAGDTFVNALIGAVVTVVFSFVPFSPVLGGAAAGYLQRGDTGDGLRVGALSGAIAALPLLLVGFLVALFVPFVPEPAFVVGAWLLLFVAVVAIVAYSAGLSALGGAIGVYLAGEL